MATAGQMSSPFGGLGRSVGGVWGGEISPVPRWFPAVLPRAVVASGVRCGEVRGADDHDAVRLVRFDVVFGEGGAQVGEAPWFVFVGVALGQPREHYLSPYPRLAALTSEAHPLAAS